MAKSAASKKKRKTLFGKRKRNPKTNQEKIKKKEDRQKVSLEAAFKKIAPDEDWAQKVRMLLKAGCFDLAWSMI